jgi:hypothetical protein
MQRNGTQAGEGSLGGRAPLGPVAPVCTLCVARHGTGESSGLGGGHPPGVSSCLLDGWDGVFLVAMLLQHQVTPRIGSRVSQLRPRVQRRLPVRVAHSILVHV